MSIADARRLIALEDRVANLNERNSMLVARVSALEHHLTDFQTAVEARQALDLSAATPHGATAWPVGDGRECPTCIQRREQAQVRLRRHRAKVTAANGKTLQVTTA